MTATREQVKAAANVVVALGAAIREAGSIPAGHLYAQCMDRISLDWFESSIALLVKWGWVKRDTSHLLTWIGE